MSSQPSEPALNRLPTTQATLRAKVVATSMGVSLGVDIAARLLATPLSTILFYRSLIALLLVLIWLRPSWQHLRPKNSGYALARMVAGGAAFLGWFGAVSCLSAPLAVAIMQLDVIALAALRPRHRQSSTIADYLLFAAVCLYLASSISPQIGQAGFLPGVLFAALGVVGRTLSQHLWERSCDAGESQTLRIGIPLLGGALAGLILAGGQVASPSLSGACAITATALLGAIGYGFADQLIREEGAYRRRVLDVAAVSGLALVTMVVTPLAVSAAGVMMLGLMLFASITVICLPKSAR